MPSFNPPLSTTSLIPAASTSSGSSWCLLTFKVTFEEHEDSSGRWEIWTDLPALDHKGELLSIPGDWHAVPFTPVPTPSPTKLESSNVTDAAASGRVKLEPALESSTATTPATTILHATVTINPIDGASYAYTFRHVQPSSEFIHWLGGEGSNGIVKVSSEASPVSSGDEGLALSFTEDDRPVVHLLPTDKGIAVRLAVFSNFSNKCPSFARVLHTYPQVLGPSKYTAVARRDLQTFDITPDAPLGTSDAQTSVEDSPSGALVSLIEVVGGDSIKVAKTHSVDGSDTEDVLAFTISGSGRDTLVIYSNQQLMGRDVDIHLPDISGGPWAVNIKGSSGPLYALEGVFPVRLPPGHTVAKVLDLLSFKKLSLSQGKSIHVSAPDAVSSSIHSASRITNPYPDLPADIPREEIEYVDESDSPELSSSVADILESINLPASVPGASIFTAIESFFLSLWAWIFGYSASASDLTDDDSISSEETDDATASEPKLDDSVSRVTSDSGLNPSPPSVGKSLPSIPPTDLAGPDIPTSPTRGLLETSVGLGASIRFTFKTSPPFKFVFPPGVDSLEKSIRFQVRSDVVDWSVAQSTFKTGDRFCTEVEVSPESSQGESWEVSLEPAR